MIDSRFISKKPYLTIKELALKAKVDIKSCIDPSQKVTGIGAIDECSENEVTFLSNAKYRPLLQESKAAACIIKEGDLEYLPAGMVALIADNPHYSYALAMQSFYDDKGESKEGVSDSAYIASSAKLGASCQIGHNVVIEDNVIIGNNCRIDSNSVIKSGVVIGNNADIRANVTISHSIIGDNFIAFPGARIGQDGFGFAMEKGKGYRIPHIGRVVIGDDVEIGANSCVDRGSMKDTIIGDHTRLDNLVQIGHNVKIGKGCIFAGQAAIAGSVTIGDYCLFGGQSGVAGHLKIGNKVHVYGQTGITKNVEDSQVVAGMPAVPLKEWYKQSLLLRKMGRK